MALPFLGVPAFFGSIGAYFAGKEVLASVAIVIKATFALTAISIYLLFIYFFINGVVDIYYLIVDFINFIQSPNVADSSGFMSNFFGVLNCIGFIDGINAIKGVVLLAVAWRLISVATVKFTIFTYLTYSTMSKALSR